MEEDLFIDIKDLSSLANLEILRFQRASLFDTSFQGLTYLVELDLINCDFKNFKIKSFRHVPNLEELTIVEPKNMKGEIFRELKKLNKLCIRGTWENYESLKHDTLENLGLVERADGQSAGQISD